MFRNQPFSAAPPAWGESPRSGRPADPLRADSLVDAIRGACLENGWDLRELARRAGVSRTTLHHLLSGVTRRPHLATMGRLARALGLCAAGGGPPVRRAVPWNRGRPDPSATGGGHAGGDAGGATFDRTTNPAVEDASRAHPELFFGWMREEWDELYSTFGVGGNLSPEGVAECARAINDRRETTRQLHLVLETHLADVARQLVETLYQMVRSSEPPNGRSATDEP
ncbi:MAG TPA: helix-turn-helix transcriptional regulator [Planctomycetaceae bacterium]|nr:helix-turn-helix transcriptional regulator [Planctomycetaceae bacterium]